METSDDLKWTFTDKFSGPELDIKELTEYYASSAHYYDRRLESLDYQGYLHIAKALENFEENKEAKILDVAAGTGLVGEKVRELGFTNIDAVEPMDAMIECARVKEIYNMIYPEFFTENPVPGIPTDSYDGLVCGGGFAPNHMKPRSLREITRIVKPGGLAIFTIWRRYTTDYPEFHEFLPLIEKLEAEGKWEAVSKTTIESYARGEPGLLFVTRVLQ